MQARDEVSDIGGGGCSRQAELGQVPEGVARPDHLGRLGLSRAERSSRHGKGLLRGCGLRVDDPGAALCRDGLAERGHARERNP